MNSSYFLCPSCTTPHHLYGSPDAFRRAASDVGVPILGELPLVPEVNKGGDTGVPFMLSSYSGNSTFEAKGKEDTLDQAGKEWRDTMFNVAQQLWRNLGY